MPKGPISDYWLDLTNKVSADCARMRAQGMEELGLLGLGKESKEHGSVA